MFSKTVEYALRAMTPLVECESGPQSSQTVEQIAFRTKVPTHYLSKVLQNLARADLIVSQRGSGGGFRLARASSEISIFQVVQAVDSIARIETCPLGLAAHGTNLCPLHKKMDDALALIESSFQGTSLADIAGDASPQKPLGALCSVSPSESSDTDAIR